MSIETDLSDLTTEVSAFILDVQARVAALEAAQGTFTPAAQAEFDALKAAIDGGVAAIGDANGDGTPATPAP